VNYSDLKANVADWLNRSDLATVVPTFIQLAEAKLNRTLRIADMYTRSQLVSTDNIISMPDDFLEFKSFRVISPVVRELHEIPAHQIDEYTNSTYLSSLDDAHARFFVYFGTNIRIIPTPAVSHTYEMNYYAKFAALSDSNTTNALISGHPDLYLYGALVAASPYLGEDERVPVWDRLLTQSVSEVQASDDRRRTKGGRHALPFASFDSTSTKRVR